jgi:hypothetical protein
VTLAFDGARLLYYQLFFYQRYAVYTVLKGSDLIQIAKLPVF